MWTPNIQSIHPDQSNMLIWNRATTGLCIKSAMTVPTNFTSLLVLKFFWNSLSATTVFRTDVFPLQPYTFTLTPGCKVHLNLFQIRNESNWIERQQELESCWRLLAQTSGRERLGTLPKDMAPSLKALSASDKARVSLEQTARPESPEGDILIISPAVFLGSLQGATWDVLKQSLRKSIAYPKGPFLWYRPWHCITKVPNKHSVQWIIFFVHKWICPLEKGLSLQKLKRT